MKRIVWDWNGTLLNDVDLCFQCINRLLISHDCIPLKTLEDYRNIFGFPIIDYYAKAGFDFDKTSFSQLADEYMLDYQDKSYSCNLYDDVKESMYLAKQWNISQTILSASKLDYLHQQIDQYDIHPFIDSIWGISDIYASSKIDLALEFKKSIPKSDHIWVVGDSIHDHEVASVIDAHCILVCRGHQSKSRLLSTGRTVLDDVKEAVRLIYETDTDT